MVSEDLKSGPVAEGVAGTVDQGRSHEAQRGGENVRSDGRGDYRGTRGPQRAYTGAKEANPLGRHGTWRKDVPPCSRGIDAPLEVVGEIAEESLCNITEHVGRVSSTRSATLQSFDGVKRIAETLESISLTPEAVSELAEKVPDMFLDILEEGIEACAAVHSVGGEVAAEALYELAIEMCSEV